MEFIPAVKDAFNKFGTFNVKGKPRYMLSGIDFGNVSVRQIEELFNKGFTSIAKKQFPDKSTVEKERVSNKISPARKESFLG